MIHGLGHFYGGQYLKALPAFMKVVAKHPELLGIGIDESTAIVVRGQEREVVGVSKVAIHDGRHVDSERQQRNGKKYYFMAPGERYDLTKLERIGKRPATEQ